MSFRLLTYNIRYGGRGREEALTATLRACEPDLVILQEATRPDVVERLAEAAGLRHWGARRRQSLGYLAREPVVHAAWEQPRISRHAFLEVVPAGSPLRVFGVHLSAVHAAWTERRRALELRALVGAIAAHQSAFHVLTGDFNTLAPDELLDLRQLPARLRALVWLSGGRVRWRTIRLVLEAGYADIYRRLHPDRPGFTFPTAAPHVRLDYVFAPHAFAPRVTSCQVITAAPAREASDHFPVLAEIEMAG